MHVHHTRVRLCHTDAAAVAFFPRQLELVHEGFEELMRHLGWPLERMLGEGHWLLPVVRVEADYKHPLRLGDSLVIRTGLERLGTRSFTLFHELEADTRLATRILTTHALLSTADNRARPLPDELREGLLSLRDPA